MGIEDYDMFGHPIALTFSKRGSAYQTKLGGWCSIIINLFMVVLCVMFAKQILFYQNDQISTSLDRIDIDDLGEMSLNETNIVVSFQLVKNDMKTVVQYDEEFKRYGTFDVYTQKSGIGEDLNFINEDKFFGEMRKC